MMTDVVAALIFENGKFMICRRPPGKKRALLWEFVGGKVEKGETKEQALKRECREELDVEVDVGEVFLSVVHEYPDLTVRLTVFCARITRGVPRRLEHFDIKWITPSEIKDYDFCPADKDVLAKIAGIEKEERVTARGFDNLRQD